MTPRDSSTLFRRLLLSLLILALSACGGVSSFTDSMQKSRAVSARLERSVGLESFVGFNWTNGVLTNVNVNFKGLPQDKALPDIADKVREAVLAEFKESPKQLVISFDISSSKPGSK